MPTSKDQTSRDRGQQDEPELFKVRKRCRECGVEWEGHSFKQHEGVVGGYCDDCVDRYQDQIERFNHRRQREPGEESEKMPELEAPIMAEEYDRRYR